jgi:hypothetical protein
VGITSSENLENSGRYTRTVSHASSTLEGGLAHEDIPALDVAGQGHPAPLGTTEGASASEGLA